MSADEFPEILDPNHPLYEGKDNRKWYVKHRIRLIAVGLLLAIAVGYGSCYYLAPEEPVAEPTDPVAEEGIGELGDIGATPAPVATPIVPIGMAPALEEQFHYYSCLLYTSPSPRDS